MSRFDVTPSAEVAKPVLRMVEIMRIAFAGGTWAATTGDRQYSVDAVTYLPGLGLGPVTGIRETGAMAAHPVKVVLPGAADSEALDAASRGVAVNYGWLFLDAAHEQIGVYWFPEHFLDDVDHAIDSKTNTLTLTLQSDAIDLDRPGNVLFGPNEQRARYPGNALFDWLHTLRQKRVVMNGRSNNAPGQVWVHEQRGGGTARPPMLQ